MIRYMYSRKQYTYSKRSGQYPRIQAQDDVEHAAEDLQPTLACIQAQDCR